MNTAYPASVKTWGFQRSSNYVPGALWSAVDQKQQRIFSVFIKFAGLSMSHGSFYLARPSTHLFRLFEAAADMISEFIRVRLPVRYRLD